MQISSSEPSSSGISDDLAEPKAESLQEETEEKRKRKADEELPGSSSKRARGGPKPVKEREKPDATDELPMNVPTKIVEGVRHLAPYWAVYRTRTKGRWIGRKMVDVFAQEFLSTNKNYAKIACKLGRIYVNGRQMTDISYVLKNGDEIHHWGHRHEHPVRDLPIRVIDETDDLLVVDKPPSLPVHACGRYAIHTVLGQLRVNEGRTGLRVLHRLDRTTSGVLLFAKNYETDLEFKKTLKEGDWSKEYVCRVEGVFPEEEIVCEQPIGTLVISMGIQCVRPDGKSAKSIFRRMWTDGETSVVQVHIETGRTHQIRIHAQYLGYPIVGDQLYNSHVWGETKGKGAEYGKPYDQLCKDVQDSHRAQQWHESIDPVYEKRMEEMAEAEVSPEPLNLKLEDRPEYDPICLNCNVVKKKVPPSHFQLYLHCLRYQTEKWCYSTPLPEWAIQPQATVENST